MPEAPSAGPTSVPPGTGRVPRVRHHSPPRPPALPGVSPGDHRAPQGSGSRARRGLHPFCRAGSDGWAPAHFTLDTQSQPYRAARCGGGASNDANPTLARWPFTWGARGTHLEPVTLRVGPATRSVAERGSRPCGRAVGCTRGSACSPRKRGETAAAGVTSEVPREGQGQWGSASGGTVWGLPWSRCLGQADTGRPGKHILCRRTAGGPRAPCRLSRSFWSARPRP